MLVVSGRPSQSAPQGLAQTRTRARARTDSRDHYSVVPHTMRPSTRQAPQIWGTRTTICQLTFLAIVITNGGIPISKCISPEFVVERATFRTQNKSIKVATAALLSEC